GGLLASVMGADGGLAHLLMTPGGGSRYPTSAQTLPDRMHYLRMEGREVFKHAVNRMAAAAQEALAQTGVDASEIACVIPHQANLRIISAVAGRLGVPEDRLFLNLEVCGNTSGASIGIALDQAVRQGRIRPGDAVLMFAFGGGFTWAATVLRWE
ncbi:MAG: 3-oxoacyl-ACP synthase, partial [Candidatus Marinimicrobia bacterium]|nr:3-oxoacyl-ACP synthase [Candidatus Neomarinimicrobiota bacterium]